MNKLREVEGIRNSALVKKYKNIFICVNKWGAFGQSDIDRCKTVPGFVTRFEQELYEKPGVATDVCYLFP